MNNPAEFVEDISVQGMLHALTIRSPVSRGTLSSIECPKLPNSYHLITAEQIPGKNELADFVVPILADKDLSYIGQPVAILAGPDVTKLEDFASKIKIIAREENPVLSCQVYGPEDIIVQRNIRDGEANKVLAKGGKIVSGNYTTGIQEHWYTEAHGAVAVPSIQPGGAANTAEKDKDKKDEAALLVYTATQWPFHVSRSIAGVLGWDSGKVIVSPTFTAVHLDGKLWYPSLVACHAALAAWVTGSPVKLMLTREEDFLYSPKRNWTEIEIYSALGEKGEILGSTVRVIMDLGAQGVFEDEIIDHTCLGSLGVYNHRAFRIDGVGVRTNIPPQGPLAGFGLSQGFFAAERHISRIADALGQDPAEWRKNNFLKRNQRLAVGTTLKDSVPLAELIDASAGMSDYYRKWSSYELLRNRRKGTEWDFGTEPLRGIGISTACQGNGFLYNNETGAGNCAVEMTLEKDGSLKIKTSLVSSETACLDTWGNLAREILGVDPALIQLINNTGEAPDAGAGTLSRNISSVTRLVERCCTTIRKQRFRDPLPITVKRSLKPGKEPGWAADTYINTEAFAHPSWGAAVVEVEIDPVSLSPLVRGIWLAVDGGKILSQRRARRTLTTGIIQALGWCCREQISYKEGKVPPEFYRNSDILTPAEIPPINVDFIWNDTADPKGIGDLPFCCVPAAYVQAVSQAMDHSFEKIPLDVRDIWAAGKLKQTENEV